MRTEVTGTRVLQQLGDELMRLSQRRSTTYPGSVLDPSAFRILWLLSERPPRTLKALAEELQLEQSTVNRQVNAAIKHGLVERCENVAAGWLHRPTAAGRAAFEHDGQLRAAVYSVVLAELGQARVDHLVEELREFNDALDRAHATEPARS